MAARGLWIDLMTLMHEASPYGHLVIAGEVPTAAEIARVVGAPQKDVEKALAELERRKVFSRTEAGVIYSRRMVRDRQRQETYAANGARRGQVAKQQLKQLTQQMPEQQLKPGDVVIFDAVAQQTQQQPLARARSETLNSLKGGSGRGATLMPPAPKNAVFAGKFVVPDWLHAEFQRKGRKTDAELRAWYGRLSDEWMDRTIGEDDPKFLRKRFQEWVGQTVAAPARQDPPRPHIPRADEVMAKLGL